MMSTFEYKRLDNPVWNSLCETHSKFAVHNDDIKFYHPDYCPFGGAKSVVAIEDEVDSYAAMANIFFIVGEKPALPPTVKLEKEIVCLQMMIHQKIDIVLNETITLLGDKHSAELYDLVNLVQPGYFKQKTRLMGNYFGIFKDNQLVAVTGERMKMNGLTEVSAVVTHPEHTGNGYAKQLVAHTVNSIFDQDNIPYLHVIEDNQAVKLYQTLGFHTRRKISFWKLTAD